MISRGVFFRMRFTGWSSCLLLALGLVWPLRSAQAAPPAAAPGLPNILICVADDWSWPHASFLNDPVVWTPNIDRIAKIGTVFKNAHVAAPSCAPSRAALLTGKWPHQLEEGGNLWGTLPQKFTTYPDLLARAGYKIGYSGKGWGPGNANAGGRLQNPAGETFPDFGLFLEKMRGEQPFCFWMGSRHPHRPYPAGSGTNAGLNLAKVSTPPLWPDTSAVRNDLLDYYAAVKNFDAQVGTALQQLQAHGRSNNTLVIITSDNGWPFPRAKANLYGQGTHVPLIISWPKDAHRNRTEDAFVSLIDLAPTILEAAKIPVPRDWPGQSLWPLLKGNPQPDRDRVHLERERHANVRAGDVGYPARAVRTEQYLYIRNFRPERWPAGDPALWKAVGPFGDTDNSPTKQFLLQHRHEPAVTNLFHLAFGPRPAEELYDLRADPWETNNVAADPRFKFAVKMFREDVDRWMAQTGDPRTNAATDIFDTYPYYGGEAKKGAKAPEESVVP